MKVLIIDDEPLIRRSLTRALKAKGHEIFEEPDGLAGLAAWQKLDPDLVILDVLMPGLTGPQVIARMSGTRAKVILISAYTGEASTESAKKQGADLFIQKPFQDIFAVVDQIEMVFNSKS